MLKLITNIQDTLLRMRTSKSERKEKTLRANVEREMTERIQLAEWEGAVYITFDGYPILNEAYFGCEVTQMLEAIADARRAATEKKIRNQIKKS